MSSNPPILLGLPRELHDRIYAFYITEDEGCYYSYKTGKLTTCSRQPLNIALAYTCRQISKEIKGVALRSNRVIFKPVTQAHAITASNFSEFLDYFFLRRKRMFKALATFITPEIAKKISARFLQF